LQEKLIVGEDLLEFFFCNRDGEEPFVSDETIGVSRNATINDGHKGSIALKVFD
jgi:hypothetical protein